MTTKQTAFKCYENGVKDGTPTTCVECGYIHCDACNAGRDVGHDGDEPIRCTVCADTSGAAPCVCCGEPATVRHLGQSDGEPLCAECNAEEEETR